MKLIRVKGHVATVGYEDSNPFSLVEWANKCGAKGYNRIVEDEFELSLLDDEGYEVVMQVPPTRRRINDGYDLDEILDDYDHLGEDDILVVIESISDMENIEGNINATIVEGDE